MSMRKVAQLAGVSTSTVSRVVNDHPNVAVDTIESVRRAMQQLSLAPTMMRQGRARGGSGSGDGSARATSVAFLVFGTSGAQPAPAFEQLLSGVSAAAAQNDLSLIFSFVSDPSQLPPRITERRVDGVLLHGEKPSAAVQTRLRALPTVWLMANRQRPEWGDQVMPDNAAIGELAADYLVRRGHHRLAYLGAGGGLWGMEIRSLAFARAALALGARADVIDAPEEAHGDLWSGRDLFAVARTLIDRLVALKERPTGLFVSEDRLLPAIDAALASHGLRSGRGSGESDVELISCNNERPHLAQLEAQPATIDIRVESIGRRGVEQLVWRLRNASVTERIRAMVEPVLIAPARGADEANPLLAASV